MELKVWVEGIQRIVCGVTVNTTCQDVVFALAHATGKVGRFTLIERWRNNERLLAPNENPLKLLLKWGEYANDVQFILQRSENKQTQQRQADSAAISNSNTNNNNNINANNPIDNRSISASKKPMGVSNANNNHSNSGTGANTVLGISPIVHQPTAMSTTLQHQPTAIENREKHSEKPRELKKKSFGGYDAKQIENIGIVKGVPQRFGVAAQNQQQKSTVSQQPSSTSSIPTSSSRSPLQSVASNLAQTQNSSALPPLIPKHEKSHSNPIEMSNSSTNHEFLGNENLNAGTNLYQQIGGQNSKSINEINLAVVRDSLDRRTTMGEEPGPFSGHVQHHLSANRAPLQFNIGSAGGSNSSSDNLLDMYNGNHNVSPDLYKNTPTISANGALVPPPYRDPPPPRNSPQQLPQQHQIFQQQQQQPMQIGNDSYRSSPASSSTGQLQHQLQQTQPFNTNNPFYNDFTSSNDYDELEFNGMPASGNPMLSNNNSSMDESENMLQATQYNDLLQLIKFQREKISSQQMELSKYDSEIVFLENKERDQAQELEAISREITKVDHIFRQGSEQLQTLQYVEEENELVIQQEKTLKSEIALLRSKLANCETELLQCKNKIRILMDDIEMEQRAITSKQKSNRQNVERDFLMEMERIQSEIDQAIHNTDSSNKTAENLKKEILIIENAIAEKKRQVEQLVNEMKEVNLQSLTVTTSEEIKHLLDGPNKPGSSRRIIGSPRQLENAVPTSKNPHGVWV